MECWNIFSHVIIRYLGLDCVWPRGSGPASRHLLVQSDTEIAPTWAWRISLASKTNNDVLTDSQPCSRHGVTAQHWPQYAAINSSSAAHQHWSGGHWPGAGTRGTFKPSLKLRLICWWNNLLSKYIQPDLNPWYQQIWRQKVACSPADANLVSVNKDGINLLIPRGCPLLITALLSFLNSGIVRSVVHLNLVSLLRERVKHLIHTVLF